MDRFIESMPAIADGDLMLAPQFGVAWQADREHIVAYDAAYYDKCASYVGQEIANKINAGRVALVDKYVGFGSVVDVGIGSGEFIRSRPNTRGHDVNPVGIEWLKRNDLWAQNLSGFAGVTMWDVIEHIDTPEQYLRQMALHSYFFASLPIFETLADIRSSKHYRPGEHLQYWTEDGFVGWMGQHGFILLDRQDFETRAGRDSILSFAFRRTRWPR